MRHILTFVIIELDQDGAKEHQLLYFVKYLPSIPHYGDYKQWQLSRLGILAGLLFSTQSPYRIPRQVIGTVWEHNNRRRQQFCILNTLEIRNVLGHSMVTIARVNALIALPPWTTNKNFPIY
jgi:hypothetical protein